MTRQAEGLACGEFFAFEGGEGGEEAEGGEGGFYLVEDFRSIGAHQVKVVAISEGHERRGNTLGKVGQKVLDIAAGLDVERGA